MLVYRIERKKYLRTTLRGIGAASSSGFRWNSLHSHMVYTSESKALAMLEISVHLDIAESLPSDRYFLDIDIPDTLTILELLVQGLPSTWNSKPPLKQSQLIGDDFLFRNEAAILKVPSSIIPTESNFLINPFHPDSNKIKVINKELIIFDQRLYK